MRRGMIGIAAMGALLLLAGGIPGNADAARSASIRVAQNTRSDRGFDLVSATGSSFEPNTDIDVGFNWCSTGGSCQFTDGLHYPTHTDARGNWSVDPSTGFGCGTYAVIRVTATNGPNSTVVQEQKARC